MRLTHIRLLVTKFDDSFRFYRDVMGLEATWGAEGEGYADFKVSENLSLALFQREEMSRTLGTLDLPYDASVQDRASLIFGTDDLDAEVTRLTQRGAIFITKPQDHPEWGIRTAYLRDPDNNLIEVNSPMPESEWTEELQEEADKYAGS